MVLHGFLLSSVWSAVDEYEWSHGSVSKWLGYPGSLEVARNKTMAESFDSMRVITDDVGA